MSFFSEYKTVNELLKQKHPVVFYAESRHYYQYFEQLIGDILQSSSVPVVYISSDKNDPLLWAGNNRIKAVYAKWMLGFLFSKMKADVMIMTMPDLGNFLFKRSSSVATYVYLFHAAVSTHQQYRKHAFDNYDAVFCTGEYQVKEIRLTEKLYGLKPKQLIAYGYPLFDELSREVKEHNEKTILVAPSWYPQGIFETCFEELVSVLSGLPYKVIIRFHPEYEKRNRKRFEKIRNQIAAVSNMEIDKLASVTERLSRTDIIITDRSGIAFESAFGKGKPVLFIDTPLKINNPEYKKIGITPVENLLRDELGYTVNPLSLHEVPGKISKLLADTASFTKKFSEMKAGLFYNSAGAYKAGADYILEKINNH